MYEPPDGDDLERGRDHHRRQLALAAKELVAARHDHRDGVECPKCLLLERDRPHLNPALPSCPSCDQNGEVSREGTRWLCGHCNLAFVVPA